MSQLADRYNGGKPEISLILEAPQAMCGLSQVLMYGTAKYARSNWKKGLPYVATIDSLLRHVVDFMNGIDIDPESGLPNVDHIQANALFLSEMFHTRPDMDNRPKLNKEA